MNPVEYSTTGNPTPGTGTQPGHEQVPTEPESPTGVKVCVCIPAHYASTRFPGKVLARETGTYLIQHTYEQACRARLPDKVIIAADNNKVVAAAQSFGAECILTSTEHKSGTDRIAEAVSDLDVKIIINVQADEPEIDPDNIDYLAQLLIDNPDYPMATLAAPFQTTDQIDDPNIVKVIVAWSAQRGADSRKLKTQDSQLKTDCGTAIYFSRLPIPYDRDKAGVGEISNYLRHLGIYAYRKDFLLKITKMPQSKFEKIEKLEQLRAIENGFPILVGKVAHTADGIDTPEQYASFVARYLGKGKPSYKGKRNGVPDNR